MYKFNLNKYKSLLNKEYIKKIGKVLKVIGLTIESEGPNVSIGSICKIKTSNKKYILAEVVGFNNNKILLMPFENIHGISPGAIVESTDNSINIRVSENLLGRVLNGIGKFMDNKGNILNGDIIYTNNKPPNPLTRNRIKERLSLGIKAIDGLLTIGKGQRVGIFAGSGVGKSTLIGMIARNTEAEINIIALIGERGREVREFIEKDLGEEGLKKSILVIATSDEPALIRLKAAEVATSIAEYFREKGKDVLLLMDSLTRYAMAQREIGLSIGEPPVSRGYTPSIFTIMPKLLERAGNSDKGSITGLYSVLVDGDDLTEPITDTARGILDGHIILNRNIASKNQYPAIDILSSISRVMDDIVTTEHKKIANDIKRYMAVYKESEDLINIGAYVKGSNIDIDMAIEKHNIIKNFLIQSKNEKTDFDNILNMMKEIR